MKKTLSVLSILMTSISPLSLADANSGSGEVSVTATVPAFTEISPPQGWPFQASIAWSNASNTWDKAETTLVLQGVQQITAKLDQQPIMALNTDSQVTLPFQVRIGDRTLSENASQVIYTRNEVHQKIEKKLVVTSGSEQGNGRPSQFGTYSGTVTITFEPI